MTKLLGRRPLAVMHWPRLSMPAILATLITVREYNKRLNDGPARVGDASVPTTGLLMHRRLGFGPDRCRPAAIISLTIVIS